MRLANLLPTIGYRDAIKIFESMDDSSGIPVPQQFLGGFPSSSYKLTSSQVDRFEPASSENSIQLKVSHLLQARYRLTINGVTEERTIRNVCAYMRGKQEPDRYIVIGEPQYL